MDVLDKLKRILQDGYKLGVEATSATPPLYIDANKFSKESLDTFLKFEKLKNKATEVISDALSGKSVPSEAELKELQKQLQEATQRLADLGKDQIAIQMDQQFQGMSTLFSNNELSTLFVSSLSQGPFTLKPDNHAQGLVCIINHPMKGQFTQESIYKSFDLKLKPEHLKPFPGATEILLEFIARHEGDHCNQPVINRGNSDAGRMVLAGEINSDSVAIKWLRQMGEHETAQALIDIRALAAADGDYLHATSIFLDHPDMVPTQAHLDAAKSFTKDMISVVAKLEGIDEKAAKKLRTEDPQHFVKTVEKALEAGMFPISKISDLRDNERKNLIAKEMGLTREQFDGLGSDKLPEVLKVYDDLKAKGAFRVDETNPYTRDYIEGYVGAVKRLVVADTSPKVDVAVSADAKAKGVATAIETKAPTEITTAAAETHAPEKAEHEPTAQEKIAALTVDALKESAEEYYQTIMSEAVAEHLGIEVSAAEGMLENDRAAYFKAMQEVLDSGKFKATFVMDKSNQEMDAILAKALGVSADKLDDYDQYKLRIADEILKNSGAFEVEYENPYVADLIKKKIEEFRLENQANPDAPKAEDAPLTKSEGLAPVSVSSAAPAATGGYDYLAAKGMPKGGSPQIVYGETQAQMMIGSVPASSFFYSFANPELAEQRIAAAALTSQFTLTSGSVPTTSAPKA